MNDPVPPDATPRADAATAPYVDTAAAPCARARAGGWRVLRWLPWLLPVLLLVLMALRPLAVPDEGRYAEVGRWMLVSGDWLVQRLDGIPFFHKPPLLYWLEASAFALFGASAWVARLVVAAHAVLVWSLLWLCARHWAGDATARRAAWVLGASAAFLIGGQYVNHDMLVASWIGVAILCFGRALLHEAPAGVGARAAAVHRGWAWAGFAACALGVLSKGLIGLLLPGLVLAVWVAWTHQWRKLPALPWFSGAALFALIAVPWFVLAEHARPGMLDYLFGVHQFGRFRATGFNNAQPAWFYLAALAVLMFPWALLLPLAAWQRVRPLWRRERAATPAWLSLCWIWLVAILGFFSLPNSKLIGYALPVAPAVALIVAQWWTARWQERRGASSGFAALVLLAAGAAVAAQALLSPSIADKSTAPLADVLRREMRAGERVVAAGEYPYDLPFLAGLKQPIEVAEDWDDARANAGDNWRRELFEGAPFDPEAARVLVPLSHLQGLDRQPGVWLVLEREAYALAPPGSRWQLAAETARWRLLRSAP